MSKAGNRPGRRSGFTLIELMVVVTILAILTVLAVPGYAGYAVRASREAAQQDLLDLATLQEKIYLNSRAYTAAVTTAYTGLSTGGLGWATGRTRDGKYTLAAVSAGQTFTITATPVAGSTQANDGNLTIASDGTKTWGTKTW